MIEFWFSSGAAAVWRYSMMVRDINSALLFCVAVFAISATNSTSSFGQSACEKFRTLEAVRVYVQGKLRSGTGRQIIGGGLCAGPHTLQPLSDGAGPCAAHWNAFVAKKEAHLNEYSWGCDNSLRGSVTTKLNSFRSCFSGQIKTLRAMEDPTHIDPDVDHVLIMDGITNYAAFKAAYEAAKKSCNN
jgi:hypothetical protein